MVDALTPEVVATQRFSAVQGQGEGYSMQEVDEFLDRVEQALVSHEAQLEELSTRLAASERERQQLAAQAEQLQTDLNESQEEVERARAEASKLQKYQDEPFTYEATPPPAVAGTLQVTTTAEASLAAARLLEHASNSAEALAAEAEEERTRLLAEATGRAEELKLESEAKAHQLVSEAEARAAATAEELNQMREEVLKTLEADRSSLQAEVDALHAYEENYRGELSAYLSSLQELISAPLTGEFAAADEEATPQDEPSAVRTVEDYLTPEDDYSSEVEFSVAAAEGEGMSLDKPENSPYPSFLEGGEESLVTEELAGDSETPPAEDETLDGAPEDEVDSPR